MAADEMKAFPASKRHSAAPLVPLTPKKEKFVEPMKLRSEGEGQRTRRVVGAILS